MATPSIIAIDGPAASGKTTVSKLLAKRLSYLYFDTGAMYRAVTLEMLRREIDSTDEQAVSKLAAALELDVVPPTVGDGRWFTILADGDDVTLDIYNAEIDANVSRVAAYPDVRKPITHHQRRVALRGEVVMVGRDVGTVVVPEADLKLYFDARVEVRAHRRWHERQGTEAAHSYEEILAALRKRDQIDAGRAVAPMKAAPDAIVIDTSDLTIDEVIAQVMALVSAIQAQQG